MSEAEAVTPDLGVPSKADLDAQLAEERRQEAAAFVAPVAEAEPEPTEPEPTEPEPTEPEPTEPEPEAVPPEVEALNREKGRYLRAIRKIIGDEVPLVECETCSGTGLVPPDAQAPPELLQHDKYRVCEECGGAGSVLTGSKVPEQAQADCPGCIGRGFKERLHEVAPAAAPQDEYGTPSWMGTGGP